MEISDFVDGVDASAITPTLWQGSVPPRGSVLRGMGFDVLVLCADELQFSDVQFPGLQVIHAPTHDDYFSSIEPAQVKIVGNAARQVAAAMQQGKKVLVTCRAGINRSSLVSAVALTKRFGISGLEAIEMIRKARPGTLQNPRFVEALMTIPARKLDV